MTLAERIGHDFADPELLERALTHRSYCAEHDGVPSNERLEFLGDAILGWVVADLSFQRFADLAEGDLTDLRKSVVNATALAEIAVELDVGPHLRLGKGETNAGGAQKASILSDAVEAIFGAVYVDGGTDAAFAVIERHVGPRLRPSSPLSQLDRKTELQEWCAQRGHPPPEYRVTSTGPDHEKVFTADVIVDGRRVGTGTGSSKKAAEQSAAEAAVLALAE
ncbi:MAG: ribonuclease III [Actinomycetota bacterium]